MSVKFVLAQPKGGKPKTIIDCLHSEYMTVHVFSGVSRYYSSSIACMLRISDHVTAHVNALLIKQGYTDYMLERLQQ